MSLGTRKTNLKRICSECDILQGQLNDASDSVVGIVNKVFTNAVEKSQQLSKALEIRDQVLRQYIDHVKNHTHAAAA
jgi:hypothetical protein